MIWLREEIEQAWHGQDPLEIAFAMEGEVYRDVPGRRTLRVVLGSRVYFLKLHYGVGWREVLKNWMVGKRPVIGAYNEFDACQALATLGVPAPVPAAYASSGGNPASRRSFVLCDALLDRTSLEDVTNAWHTEAPSPLVRLRMLRSVATFARTFHGHGFIHRDFYICHLLADNAALNAGRFDLAVLDLHRARRFERIPRRWLLRDLAALLFSVMDLNFSQRDWLRFVRLYSGKSLRALSADEWRLWRDVLKRAEKLYQRGQRKGLVAGHYRPFVWPEPGRSG